jgi:hypothetical protein
LNRIHHLTFLARLKKHHGNTELVRQFDSTGAGSLMEERLRNAYEHSGAIAAAAIRIHSTAMGKPLQSAEPSLDHGMRRRSAQLRDKTHATGIMIVREGEATFRHTTGLT